MSVLQQQYSSGKMLWQSIWIRIFHVVWSFDIDLETFWWSFRWWWIASMHFSWLIKPSYTICRERKITIWNLSIFRTLRSSKFSLGFQSSNFRQRCSREKILGLANSFFDRKHAVTKTIERIGDDIQICIKQPVGLVKFLILKKSSCVKWLQIFFPRKWLSIIFSKLIFLSCCDVALTSSNAHPVYKFLSLFISI